MERGPTAARARREASIFIGDSVTDIEAGQAAGVPTIGYANKPGKHERLATAGAHVVIGSMRDIAEALHSVSVKSHR